LIEAEVKVISIGAIVAYGAFGGVDISGGVLLPDKNPDARS
jgi:hypothetical protein